MSTRFYFGQPDYIDQLNNMDDVATASASSALASANAAAASAAAAAASEANLANVVEDQIVDGQTIRAPSQNAVFDALILKAPLASPALTGTPTAPTASNATNTTRLATTAFAQTITKGYLSKSVAGGVDVTLTADEAAYAEIQFTGVLTANINVIMPAVPNNWVIHNSTTGAFNLIVKNASTAGVTVKQGNTKQLYCNGTQVFNSRTDFDAISIANGGSISGSTLASTGNLTFNSTGQRILGDFFNGTISNRMLFQTSTANQFTSVGSIPNGTSTTAGFTAWNSSDPNNASVGIFECNSNSITLTSATTGTGILRPIRFMMSATEYARFDPSGNFGIGVVMGSGNGYAGDTTSSSNATFRLYDTADGLTKITNNLASGYIKMTAAGLVTAFNSTSANGPYCSLQTNGTTFGYFGSGAQLVSTGATANDVALRSETGNILFARGSTESMRINTSGNVGIGENNPSTRLQVAYNQTMLSSGVGATVKLISQISANSDYLNIGWTGEDTWGFQSADSIGYRNLSFQPFGGNVGIGVTPSQKLHIAGTGNTVLRVDSTDTNTASLHLISLGANYSWKLDADSSWRLSQDNTERFRIDTQGNLLLGTTTNAAGAKLVMIGNFMALSDGTYTAYAGKGSNLVATGAASDFAIRSDTNLLLAVNGSSEAMRLDSGGNMLVGATSGSSHKIAKPGSTVSDLILDVAGSSVMMRNASSAGYNTSAYVLAVGKITATGRSINAEGTVNASGADYAEYMTKAEGCGTLTKGQIVGVDAQGKLTDKWADAISFLIKSTNPSYVGGDTWGTEEALGITRPIPPQFEHQAYQGAKPPTVEPIAPVEPSADADYTILEEYANSLNIYQQLKEQYDNDKEAYNSDMDVYVALINTQQHIFDTITWPNYLQDIINFEAILETARQKVDRIAYCGQVPVNILNAEVGQYIIPSQNGESIDAILVNEENITLNQYIKAVGVVQNILPDGRANVRVKPV